MSSKTRIIVLRMKEIIYTAIFIGFAILLILLFLFMFRPEDGKRRQKQLQKQPRPTHRGSIRPRSYSEVRM